MPSDVICQRLKKKSAEICALRYAAKPAGEEITAASDFSKLRVSQLKAYLAEKNVDCASCFEKADFEQAVKRHLGVKDL